MIEWMTPTNEVDRLIADHEAWRSTTLNLIASENLISPAVRRALNNDLVGRYTDYTGRDLDARRYRGNRYVVEIEKHTEALAKRVFRASEVDLRPLSGHIAGACVILGLCQPGDLILEVGSSGGSHRMAAKLTAPAAVSITSQFLPFDEARWNVDLPATLRLIEQTRPKMVILGNSAFLFPHPVRDIAAALHQIPDSVLVYDGSHVMGLIAGGLFQDPLEEGADIVYGSTHKTLPGPQGGILYSNSSSLMDRIADAIYPALITNHHSFRMPALAATLDEMAQFGGDYARQTIANAQALGAALAALSVPPLTVDNIATQSHTLLVPVAQFSPNAAERLETCGIILNNFRVPEALGGAGLRLGTQEITRMGAVEADMPAIAEVIVAALAGREAPDVLTGRVRSLVQAVPGLAFA
jgi:glycine hydroxymethyltransferase